MHIYVIVVIYNGKEWIDSCFGSLSKSNMPLKIIAIDNASTDGTPEKIKKDFPEVLLMENKINLGFGRANNIGFRKALENNADYVFLLNQDARVEPDTIRILVENAEINEEYGLLAPVQLNGDGTAFDQVFALDLMKGKFSWFYSDLFTHRKKLRAFYRVEFVPAAAWLLPVNTLKIIGGFDPLFPHYGEDDNYLQRLKYHGFKAGICPESRIYHHKKFETEEEMKAKEQSLAFFEKELKINYADVNRKRSLSKYFFNMWIQTCRYLLKSDFGSFRKNLQRLKIIRHAYGKIKQSLKKNRRTGMHYIPE